MKCYFMFLYLILSGIAFSQEENTTEQQTKSKENKVVIEYISNQQDLKLKTRNRTSTNQIPVKEENHMEKQPAIIINSNETENVK